MKRKRKLSRYRIAQIVAAITFILICIGQLAYNYFNRNKTEIIQSDNTEKIQANFHYIHDGDTAVFLIDGNEVVCRFLAVDCPEMDDEGYIQANNYTKNTLSNAKKIILELDPNSDKYDKYDRLLAWVWVDDILLQAKLIENNHATIRYLYDNYLYTQQLYNIQKNVTK